MPEISRFFGIRIRTYNHDHLPAHFHAVYADDEVLIEIDTLGIYSGKLPNRALTMVLEWAAQYRDDLRLNWALAQSGRRPEPIPPPK